MNKINFWTIFVLTVLVLSSCVTQKKCLQKFPPQTIRERYDSIIIKDTIIYKDVIVEKVIPADTVYVDRIIPGIPQSITTRPMILENDYAIAKGWIQDSRLKMQLEQKYQVLRFKLDSADKLVRHWQFQYLKERELNTHVVVQKFTPKIYKIALWGWVVLIIAGSAWVYVRIKSKGLKSLLNAFIKK